jgi:hypothetical protein
MEATGKAPPGLHRFSDEITHERIISAYFNGDLIHFDRGSQQVSEWGADAFDQAHRELQLIQAMLPVAVLYVRFAGWVQRLVAARPRAKWRE